MSKVESLSQAEDGWSKQVTPVTPQTSPRSERVMGSSSADSSSDLQAELGDDIDEFQMYQRFRLRMVQIFGSMASALFEFGADPETGRISQEQFGDVVANRLKIMSAREAKVLFKHFTNADPTLCGVGGFATFKDFSITEREWKFTVAGKSKECTAMPFASGPSGGSSGVYLRQITVASHKSKSYRQVSGNTQGVSTPMSTGQPNTEASGVLGEAKSSKQMAMTTGSFKKRPQSWRQPQKTWAPSVFAGMGIPEEVNSISNGRFRPCEQTFRTSGKITLDPSIGRIHDPPERKADYCTKATSCPTRRAEMQSRLSETQVQPWWPYKSKAPVSKLNVQAYFTPRVISTDRSTPRAPRPKSKPDEPRFLHNSTRESLLKKKSLKQRASTEKVVVAWDL
eukprot:TRINITY_DN100821_c0_g1_i1.p1 TRINITY_DN100821_c0_g1~~TRINITY_DN100821_c0_g1_i1.p1  ORF type:complete len:396 (+),score=52.54 TRINITY_DN100821_c0_g1_i1:108-1295(+)